MRMLRILCVLVVVTALLMALPGGTVSAAYTSSAQYISASSPVTDIECPSATNCYVVSAEGGNYEGGDWPSGTVTPLTIASDGTVQSGEPELPGYVPWIRGDSLTGIDCTDADTCYVTGWYVTHAPDTGVNTIIRGGVVGMTRAGDGTLTGHNIRWVDGTISLDDISCPTSDKCYAAGHSGNQAVVVSISVENGSVDPNEYAHVPSASSFSGIDCPTATTCYAVGKLVPWEDPSHPHGVVATLQTAEIDNAGDGGDIGSVQIIDGTSSFSRIACPTATTCFASGESGNIGQLTLMTANGTSVSPNFTQTFSMTSRLGAIACLDANTCYVVGESSSGAVVVEYSIWNSPAQHVLAVANLPAITCAVETCHAAGFNAIAGQSVLVSFTPQALIATNVTLSSSAGGPDYGQALTFTAIVAPTGGGGVPSGTVQFAVDGVVSGGPVALIENNGQAQATLNVPKLAAGSHTITATYSGDNTYAGSAAPAFTQTVQKVLLTIAADDKTMVEGQAIPTLTYTASGFVAGDTTDVLDGAPSLSTIATPGSLPGDYPITIGQGTLAAGNYSFTFTNGTLTISSSNATPIADARVDQTVVEGATVTLDGSGSSDPDQDELSYAWEVVSQTGPTISLSSTTVVNPSFATTDNGSYTLQLTVADGNGGEHSDDVAITVENEPPTATFNAPDVVDEGSGITLSLTAPQDPSSADTQAGFSYAFDCGDGYGAFGASSTAICPPRVDDGSLTVKGKIRDDDGGVSEYTAVVTIENVAPTATFTAPDSVDEGSAISIALSDASDAGSTDRAAGFSYAFDCGSGYGGFGTSSVASCPTTDDGSLTVKGQIRDQDGGTSAYTKVVTVKNVAPTATFYAPVTVDEGQPFGLSLSDPADPSLADVQAGFSYAFDCGSGYGAVGSSSSLTCPAAAGGSLTVKGTLSDKDGGVRAYTVTVNVTNVPPTVTINGAPETGLEGTAIALTSTVTDPGLPEMFSYAWSVSWDGQPVASSSQPDFSFIPGDEGSYLVTLVVTDAAGGAGRDEATIVVANVAPRLVDLTSPATQEGELATVTGVITDPGTQDRFTLTVDWGEGEPVNYEYEAGTTAFSATHVYADDNPSGTAADDYQISLSVADGDGGTGSATLTQRVSNVAPLVGALQVEGYQVTLAASDAGGAGDPLGYAIDCDGDGEADQWGTDGRFTCPAYTIVIDGTVWVTDDDLGSVASAFQIVDPLELCANRWNGQLAVTEDGACGASAALVRLPEAGPLVFCVNVWSGQASYRSTGTCGRTEERVSYPELSPLAVCVNAWNGNVRMSEECDRTEWEDWW